MKTIIILTLSVLSLSLASAQSIRITQNGKEVASVKISVNSDKILDDVDQVMLSVSDAVIHSGGGASSQTAQKKGSISEMVAKTFAHIQTCSVVTITPEMLEMISALNTDFKNSELEQFFKTVTNIRVINIKGTSAAVVNNYSVSKLQEEPDYKEMVNFSQGLEKTRISAQMQNGKVLRWILLSYTKENFTLVEIEGPTDIKTIGKALNTMNIKVDTKNILNSQPTK